MGKLLTVEEFAEYYRTTSTTVYRWLKQGKLTAVKIGKEWRIDEDALQTTLAAEAPQTDLTAQNIWAKLNENEHLMVLAESKEKVYEAEASFFKYAVESGKVVMKGCWWQDPDEIEEKFYQYGLDVRNLTKDGLFKLVDFTRLYKKHGIKGPVECWRTEIYKNRRNSLWASGSPCVESCGGERNLLSFERQLNDAIKNMPVIGICPYYTEEFRSEGFSKLTDLIKQHSGIVFYDEVSPSLLRQ